MLRPVDKLNNYKYSCDTCIISMDGSSDTINIDPKMVNELAIIKEYDELFAPLIRISFATNRANYIKLQTNTEKISVTIRISKQLKKGNETDDLNNDISQKSVYLKNTFRVVNEEDIDPTILMMIHSDDGQDVDTRQDELNIITFFLFDPRSVNKYRKTFALNLASNHTKTDWIYKMLVDRNIGSVLMSPVVPNSSGDRYIPIGDLGESLNKFNELYGIYGSSPFMFFMDFDATYLLNVSKSGQTVRKNEKKAVTLYLDDPTLPSSLVSGCYTDDRYNFIQMSLAPELAHIEEVDYSTWGTMNVVVSGEAKTAKVQSNGTVERSRVSNTQHMVEQDKFNINLNRNALFVSLESIDLDMLTPNKKFTINAHNHYKKLAFNGDYVMTSNITIFNRLDDTNFSSVTSIKLKKLPK